MPPKSTPRKAAGPLRALHALGTKVRVAMGDAKRGKGASYAPGIVVDYAAQLKMPTSSLYKAVQFAETYTAEELEELCRANGEQSRLGIGHVYELLQVPKRSARKKLQQQAVKHRWSVRRLQAERRKRMSMRKSRMVGRPPKLATDLKGLLDQLQSESWRLKRWLTAFASQLKKFEGVPNFRKLERLITRQQSAVDDLQKHLPRYDP